MMLSGPMLSRVTPITGAPSVVESYVATARDANNTHPITLPSGIQVGDLLVAFAQTSSTDPGTITAGNGWNVLGKTSVSPGYGFIVTKVATGTDTLTLSFTGWTACTVITYRVSGAHTLIQSGTSYGGQINNFDPPDLFPADTGRNGIVFISAGRNVNGDAISLSEFPESMSSKAYKQYSVYTSITVAHKNYTTATWNPGRFHDASNTSGNWRCFSIIVYGDF